MDGKQFDRITRALAEAQSRRTALKKAFALIGVGALVRPETVDAARRGYTGPLNQCRSDEVRCDGECYSASTTECCAGNPCPLGQCSPSGECCSSGAAICGDSCCWGTCLDGSCCSSDFGYVCSPGDGSVYCAPNGSCCTANDCPDPGDQCWQAFCLNGTCTSAAVLDGAWCDDFDLCTGPGSCVGGECQPGAPVVCDSPGACQLAEGTCDPSSGTCVYPTAPDGTPCDNGRECMGGQCVSVCSAGLGESCTDEEECCQDRGVTYCEGVCCLANYESCSASGECCSGQCNGDFCCAGPGDPCSDDGECCNSDFGVCSNGVCQCRFQGENCTRSSECCGNDMCVNGTCAAGACTRMRGTCHSGDECCQMGGTAYCLDFGYDYHCCRSTGGDCASTDECCEGVCFNGECCRRGQEACTIDDDCCSRHCCNGVCCDYGLGCINGICRHGCTAPATACGATECCGPGEHCIDGSCMCLPLNAECDPDNNLCCRNGTTMCYPDGTVGMKYRQCCQGLGSPCDRAHDAGALATSDCCSRNFMYAGAWWGPCGFDDICGGRSAVCAIDGDCVSGQCRGHCDNQFPVKYCSQHSECHCTGDFEDGCVTNAGFCTQKLCV